jgi:hypothetical protein
MQTGHFVFHHTVQGNATPFVFPFRGVFFDDVLLITRTCIAHALHLERRLQEVKVEGEMLGRLTPPFTGPNMHYKLVCHMSYTFVFLLLVRCNAISPSNERMGTTSSKAKHCNMANACWTLADTPPCTRGAQVQTQSIFALHVCIATVHTCVHNIQALTYA